MSRVLAAILTLAALNDYHLRGAHFQSARLYPQAGGPLTVADFDNDGRLDWTATGFTPSGGMTNALFRNQGSLAFVRQGLPGPDIIYGTALVADVENDGDADLARGGWVNGFGYRTQISRNDGGDLRPAGDLLPGQAAVWADLDGDGDPDLLTVDGAARGARIWWNDGHGHFALDERELGASVDDATGVDYDNDGDADLLIHSRSPLATYLYRNDGQGRFDDTGIAVPLAYPSAATWGDFNGDAILDALGDACDATGNLTPNVVLNDGTFQFTALFPIFLGQRGTPAMFADLNNDDRLDAFLAGAGVSVSGQPLLPASRVFLRGPGLGFPDPPLLLPAVDSPAAAVADFDGDGDLDLLLGGSDYSSSSEPGVRVYRNTITARLAAPPPPRSLTATLTSTGATLQWGTGEGSTTPGYTYNLRVGTQPGQGDVLSALAAADGTRRVTGLGNAHAALRRPLRNLAPGTYYWSVQSVGHAFAASAFAPEASFTITGEDPNTPPTIAPISHQVTSEDMTAAPIPLMIGDLETSAAALKLTFTSSNPQLVPLPNLAVGGTGADRGLYVQPATNRFGTTLITVTVTDEGELSASSSFVLTVLPVNDPPSLDPIPNQTAFRGGPPVMVTLLAADVETLRWDLSFDARSADERLIPNAGLKFTGGTAPPTLEITPATNRVGSTTVTVTVSDGEQRASAAFVVTVAELPYAAEDTGLRAPSGASLSVADYDNDDDMDLLVATQDPRSPFGGDVRLYRNDGRGTFLTNGFVQLPALTGVGAAWADCDRDGDLDLALCGWATRTPRTVVLGNNGDGTFTELDAGVPGFHEATIEWGDFDGDGLPDLLLAGRGLQGSVVRLYRNEEGRRFAAFPLPQPGFLPIAAAAGDFDRDGRLDFALSGYTASNRAMTRLYRNTPSGFDATEVQLELASRELGWHDLDGDGDEDLWMLVAESEGRVATTSLRLFANDGHGHLAPPVILTDLGATGVWGDYDADGDWDFVDSGQGRVRSSFPPWDLSVPRGATAARNDGAFRFGAGGAILGTNTFNHAVCADFDADGALDLVATTGGRVWSEVFPVTQSIILLRNVTGRANPVPSAPDGLRATVSGSGVTLSWSPAADENQAASHTYNVRVGTFPGGADVVAGAGPNGFVRTPASGNAGLRTSLTLTNLTGETYYWSVQAVDESFAGSAFAFEQSFVITSDANRPPTFGAIPPATTPEEGSIELPIPLEDDRTPTPHLRVQATASDPFLIPYGGLATLWTGTNWLVRLTPATNLTGVAEITLVATDAPGLRATNTFTLTVTPVNDAPVISAIPDQAVAIGYPTEPIPFTIGDVETPPAHLALHAVSDNPALVPTENIVFGGAGAQRTLTLTSARTPPGRATIDIIVQDEDGGIATARFVVTVKEQSFTPIANPFARFRGDTAAWGDYDGDGRLDLLIAGDAGATLTKLYHNDGDGRFSESGLTFPPTRGGVARWGDLDNDGDLDLLLVSSLENAGIHLYRNEGANGFTRLDLTTTGYGWSSAAWGDYDNDGRLDFVVAGDRPNDVYYDPVARLYRNDGQGRFTPSAVALPRRDGPVAWTDFDRDGWADLLLGGTDRNMTRFVTAILRNDGRGTAFAETVVTSGFTRSSSQPADLDGDGWFDLAVGEHAPTAVSLYRNGADGIWAPWLTPLPLTGSVAIGDYSNDGWPDIFIAGYGHDFFVGLTNGTHLFRSEAGTNFVIADADFPLFDIAGPAAWGDMDNDDDLDLLLVGQREGGVYATQIYRNDSGVANAPPNPPATLRAVVTGDAVRLEWDAAVDPNQTATLTYNVRLGTRPGAGDVLSPMSLPSGVRQVPAPGNAGGRQFLPLARLPLGRSYFWSVQAVDNAFIGSPFATEASFYASHPPTMSEIAEQTVQEDESTPAIPFAVGDADDPVDTLTLTAVASDPLLVPAAGIRLEGTGPNRTLAVRPGPDAFGATTVTVTVTDPWGAAATRSFLIVVLPENDTPLAPPQTVTLAEDTSAAFVLEATDVDGDALQFTISAPPAYGLLSGTAPQLTYQPAPDFFGEDSFQYWASDGQRRSRVATVRLIVTPVPDNPAERIEVRVTADGEVWLDLLGEPRQRYRIDASVDLATWLPLVKFEGARNPVRFREVLTGTWSMRFYRVIPLP